MSEVPLLSSCEWLMRQWYADFLHTQTFLQTVHSPWAGAFFVVIHKQNRCFCCGTYLVLYISTWKGRQACSFCLCCVLACYRMIEKPGKDLKRLCSSLQMAGLSILRSYHNLYNTFLKTSKKDFTVLLDYLSACFTERKISILFKKSFLLQVMLILSHSAFKHSENYWLFFS